MTRAITVDVVATNGTTVVDTLESDRNREWLDDLSAEGSFSFEIKRGHADEALLTDGRYVRFSVGGTARWQGIIEQQEPVEADPGARESGRVARVSGRGSLAVLERARVYPELGLGRVSPDTRYMNFASLDFDDTAWGNAVELKAQNDTDKTKPWYGAPKGWKDRAAKWVGPTGGMTPPVTPGDIYLRGSFTIGTGEGGEYRFMLSADDEFELYVDGNKVSAQKGVGLWGVTHTADLLLDEGTHLAAVKVTNLDRPVSATNVFGFIMSVYKLLGGGDTLGAVVSRSSTGTKMLAYPAAAPGMTVGQILDIFLTEAQARGTLAGLTWDFDAADDSDGTPWPAEIDVSFPVGTSLLEVVKHLVEEHACDVSMAPDSLTLHAHVSKGSDLSATVEAEYGVNIGRLAFRKTTAVANVGLIRTAENRWYESADATSVTAHGRRETHLTLGSAPSDDAAERQIAAFFEDNAYPITTITDMQLEAVTAVPGDDFVVGDTIAVLADPYRVHGLRTTEDVAGQPIYTPELLAV